MPTTKHSPDYSSIAQAISESVCAATEIVIEAGVEDEVKTLVANAVKKLSAAKIAKAYERKILDAVQLQVKAYVMRSLESEYKAKIKLFAQETAIRFFGGTEDEMAKEAHRMMQAGIDKVVKRITAQAEAVGFRV